MDSLIYNTALSFNKYIGPARYRKIKTRFPDLEGFFSLPVSSQMEELGIRSEQARPDFENMVFEAEKIVKICTAKKIMQVMEDSPLYPERLKSIPDPPFMIYVLGDLQGVENLIAIVGTRSPSLEAGEINRYFTREFCNLNIGIVSGLAKGHDMIAAAAALESDGYTIAVLGSGIDVVYPRQSAELYKQICRKGAVVSEYPPGMIPETRNFPMRNRIISGMADAVLVIQAPDKSGALITAGYASSQGRDLYVIPGNPMEEKNRGSNRLIQNGARVAASPGDMAAELFGIGSRPKKIPEESAGISREEKAVLDQLGEETGFEKLLGITGSSVMELNHILMKLELKGLVIQYPGRYYIRKASI